MKRSKSRKTLFTKTFTCMKKIYVHEIAAIDLSKIFFLKNAKETCKSNNRDLNCNYKKLSFHNLYCTLCRWILKVCHVAGTLFFTLYLLKISRYPQQNSKGIFLDVGKNYYLEGLFMESRFEDHMEIGVYLPDGSSLLPITSHYLSADPN